MKKTYKKPGFRDILYKWILIKDWQKNNELKSILKNFKCSNLLGFIYIDHECGLTLDIVKLFNEKNGKITSFENLKEMGLRIIDRYENFIGYNFEILNESEVNIYSLPDQKDIIQIYSSKKYEKLREREGLDPFRSESFPDDIQVFLFPLNDLEPEIVWCRLENMREEENFNIYEGILLNNPNQNFKVKMGEKVDMVFSQTPYGNFMVCKTSLDRLKSNKVR